MAYACRKGRCSRSSARSAVTLRRSWSRNRSTAFRPTTAPTAPLEYRSSFEDYQRFEPQKPASWRAANRAIGAPSGRAVETAPAAPPPEPAAGGHAGHKH